MRWKRFCALSKKYIVVPSLENIKIDCLGDKKVFYFRYRQNAAKIMFSLFSRHENRAKLSVHFKLQVGNR